MSTEDDADAARAAEEDQPANTLAPASRTASDRHVLPWLSPSNVAAAVREQEPAFGACQTLGNESRSREGAITVGWLVGADGSVSEVTLGRTTFSSDLVNDCMLSVARKVIFPASQTSAQVVWTVRLRGADDGTLAEASRYRDRH